MGGKKASLVSDARKSTFNTPSSSAHTTAYGSRIGTRDDEPTDN